MKTSNQLLIGLLAVIFVAIAGTAMILKAEFEKIDKDDPFYGYTLENPPPFQAVKLEGNCQDLVQLQPSDTYEIRMNERTRDRVTWKMHGDTLVVSFDFPVRQQPDFYDAFYSRSASVYIMLPHLSSLNTHGVTSKLTGWKEARLQLMMQGSWRGLLLTESNIGHLSASVAQGGFVLLEDDNRITQAQVAVRDSSSFTAKYHAIDSLDIQMDSTAQVALPGSLFSRLAR